MTLLKKYEFMQEFYFIYFFKLEIKDGQTFFFPSKISAALKC